MRFITFQNGENNINIRFAIVVLGIKYLNFYLPKIARNVL